MLSVQDLLFIFQILKGQTSISLLRYPCLKKCCFCWEAVMKQYAIPAHLVASVQWRIKTPNKAKQSHHLSARPPNDNRAQNRKQESVTTKLPAEVRGSDTSFWDRWSTGNSKRSLVHPVLCKPQLSAAHLHGKIDLPCNFFFFLCNAGDWCHLFLCYIGGGGHYILMCLLRYGDQIKASSWLNKSPAFNTFTWVADAIITCLTP